MTAYKSETLDILHTNGCKPLTEDEWEEGLEEFLEEWAFSDPHYRITETDKNVARNDLLEMRVRSKELLVFDSNFYHYQKVKDIRNDIDDVVMDYLDDEDWDEEWAEELTTQVVRILDDMLA